MKNLKVLTDNSPEHLDCNCNGSAKTTKVTLDRLTPGQSGVICCIDHNPLSTKRISEMGFTIGTNVKMVRLAPLMDPIEFEIRGYLITMRKEEARLVHVNQSL